MKNMFEVQGDIEYRKRTTRSTEMPQRKLAQVEKAEQTMNRRQNVRKIKERKEVKWKIEGARSERLKQRWREAYSA